MSQSTPPNGLQLTLDRSTLSNPSETEPSTAEIDSDGELQIVDVNHVAAKREHTDTLVMKTVGYWQLRGNPGVWDLRIAEKHADIYSMVQGTFRGGRVQVAKDTSESTSKTMAMKDFTNQGRFLLVKKNKGFERASLFPDEDTAAVARGEKDTVHVFSLATGHAYERLLKIMMLSVTRRTSSPVKFWLFENVSPNNLYGSLCFN